MATSSLSPDVVEALDRMERKLTPWFDQWSLIRDIRFLAADRVLDVAHRMGDGVVPDGFAVVIADGPVYAAPGKVWTDQVAYLQTGRSNVRADVVFFTLREN